MSKDIKMIGQMDNSDGTFESANRVYDRKYVAPTIPTCGGGGIQPKVIKKVSVIGGIGDMWGEQYRQQYRVIDSKQVSYALSAELQNVKVVRSAKNIKRTYKATVAMRGREKKGQCLEYHTDGITNTITTVQKDNMTVCMTTTTGVCKVMLDDYLYKDYGVFKLTPRECLRLMAVRDDDIDKMMYEVKEWKGDDLLCCVKSQGVIEKQKHTDSENYVLSITKDLQSMEQIYPKTMKSTEMPKKEFTQNVNIVIEKLADVEQKECVISITKCLESTEMLCTLMEEIERCHTAIIGSEPKGNTNTGKYMRITSEENLSPKKLYTILTLIKLITESKIFTSTIVSVNICGCIASTGICENNMEKLRISNLKMVGTYTRVSPTQCYKQAGNSIVVTVLMAIFSQLNIKGVTPWNELDQEQREQLINDTT